MAQSPFDNDGVRAALAATLDHARDLLDSAQLLNNAGKPNIAYHLATLALEEVGRRELLAVQVLSSTRPIPPAWPAKHMSNHYQKLFWSFFGANFLTKPITAKEIEELRTLAKQIHETRLAGLYVDTAGDELGIPREAIEKEEVGILIRLAEARIGIAATQEFRDTATDEDLELTEWFLNVVDEPAWRKYIFSSESMNQLATLADGRAWITWLKEKYDASSAVGITAAQTELARTLPKGRTRDKWRMKLRIISASHAIAPKVLSRWNKHVPEIQLSLPDPKKKHELVAELLLGDDVPVQGLYWWGDVNARRFLVALNMATSGLWYWFVHDHPGRFFEFVVDLDNGMEMRLDYDGQVLPYKADAVLQDGELRLAAATMVVLATFTEQQAPLAAFDRYLSGLTWFAVNDVTLRFDADAFYAFCDSLRELFALSNDPRTLDAATIDTLFAECFPGVEEHLRKEFVAQVFLPEPQRGTGARIRSLMIAYAKGLCDYYFVTKVGPMFPAVWFSSAAGEATETPDSTQPAME